MADEFDANAAVSAYLNGAAPTPETTLRASLYDAVTAKPDYEADLRRTAQAVGMPIDTARALPEYAKQQKALQDIDTSALARMNPVTTSFLSQPENAAIAHDDTANMGSIEALANSFRRGVPGLEQGLSATALRSNQAALEQFDKVAARIDAGEKPTSILANDDPLGVAFMTPEQRTRYRAQISTPLATNVGAVARTQRERAAIPSPEVVGQVMGAKTFGEAFSAFMGNPVGFIASIGPESLVANAPGLVAAIPAGIAAGPAGAASVLGAGSFATDYGSSIVDALTKAGVDVRDEAALREAVANKDLMRSVAAQAMAHAAVVGSVDALSGGAASKLALPKGIATRMASKPVARELANIAAQVPIQGTLGAAGEAGGELAAGQPLDPGNILAEFVGEAFTAPAEVAGVAITQVRERVAAAREANETAARVEQLTKLAEASKLRERDPATFKAFVDQVSEGSEAPNELYINAEQLANTLNQAGIGMEQLTQIAPTVAQQMSAPEFMPGADIRIPVSELLTAPAEITTPLIDHLRASPEAMSRAEAQTYLTEQGETLRAEVETALKQRTDVDAFQADVARVRDQFQAELDTAGKFRPEVNKAYATLLGNFYAAQALRAGVPLPEFLDRYKLNVTAKTPVGGQEAAALSPEVQAADALLTAVDAGGVPLNPAKVNQIARAMGLDVGKKAPVEKTIQRIRAAVERAKNQSSSRQTVDQAARATLTFANDITTSPSVIALLEGANLSSFLHESGHFFLEVQADLAARVAAQAERTPGEQQILDDMGTLLNWFGVKGTPDQSALVEWQGMSIEQRREHHEQFARSFERYTMEGNAPSQELVPLFQRFRAWLVSIYKALAALNSNLTDDVRSVMGRMIASDTAIQSAQAARGMGPLFSTPEQAGMTLDEYLAYQNLGAAATGVAESELDARLMKDMKWLSGARDKALKAAQAQATALRNGVEAQVRGEVMGLPVYRAWQFLTGKREQVVPGVTPVESIDVETETGKLRTSLVKEMDAAAYETLSARRMTSENAGMHPDIVAELFGYASGQEMLSELATAQDPEQVIEGMTDQRMLEEHGDITTPAALGRAADQAVHSELRARVIATELKALAKATKVRDESPSAIYGARNTIDVMARAAREYAARVVSRLQLKNIRPQQYTAAEARSAKLAMQSLGNTAEAAMHKRNQLVNNFAAKEAYAAQEEIRKTNEFFKRVLKGNAEDVGKTRDYGMVQAARAILAAYGIAGAQATETATSYLDTLAKNDPQMHAILADRIGPLVANAKPVATMTVEEFRGLTEEIRSIWFMAKRSKQVEIDGKLVDREVVQGELVDSMVARGVPTKIPGEGQAVTQKERNITKLQSLRAALRRVESWVGFKDGKDQMGPFRRNIWQPIKEAADKYRADKAVYIKKYKALLESLDLGKERIDAPELGYVFGYSRGGSGKAEILHAILHTGNESNKRKLLLGRRWATENADGTLDTTNWDAFIKRVTDAGKLTKADYDFAQGVWNLLEETKPLAQKTHRDVFGHYFAEITADGFDTPFGHYAGGYVPAMADPEIVKDAATRALQEDENQTLAYSFPSTTKGFTKSRVEYNKPLLLDLRTLSTHIDKVLLFSHLEGPVRDVRRILGSPQVSETLHRVDPTAYDSLLTPWLNRAARQTVETKVPGDNNMMRFFSLMRQRAGVTAMFANVSNVMQQITGLSIAAVKVKPTHLMGAMAGYIIAPRQTAKTVAENSTYMANRMDNEVAAMTDAINDILLNPSVFEKAQNWTAKHAYFLQSAFDNVLGPIVWTGAFNQALEQGHDQRNAIRLADSAVRETQGSTLAEDVSRIETGNAFVRMFTQFAGYFNMQANLLGTEFGNAYHELGLRKGMGRGFYIFMLGYVVPNVLAEMIAQAFKGGPDDEDKDGSTVDDWLWATLVMGNVKSSIAMIPGVGQVINAGINTFNKKPYDDRISTSPAVSMIESAVAAPHSVYQAVANGGDSRKAVRDLATLISMTTGLPASAIARPLGYMTGVSENKIQPTSTADAVRGAITGTPSPESKR